MLEAVHLGLAVTCLQGMISGEELSSAYASADIFMMPSESETLGFVALEAMASGLAVVAVAAGGLVDIITKPGVIGISSAATPFFLDHLIHRSQCGHLKELTPLIRIHRAQPRYSSVKAARLRTWEVKNGRCLSRALSPSAH